MPARCFCGSLPEPAPSGQPNLTRAPLPRPLVQPYRRRPEQAKAKIMVIKDVEREDIEFISKTLHCLPIAHVDHMRPDKLGHADLVEEVDVSRGAGGGRQRASGWMAPGQAWLKCLPVLPPAGVAHRLR